nr:hypothetical protein [Rhodococcus sp. (in: high G+C Gram-positive bacteria)]
MRSVLAIVIGSNDMTVATFDSAASSAVSIIDRTVVGTDVHIGDDARVVEPARRVGDPVPIFLPDGRSATGATLVARSIAELAARRAHDAVVVVHPATWTRQAVSTLDAELGACGVSAQLVDRPTVADRWLRSVGAIPPGAQAVVVEAGADETVVSCSRSEAGRTGVVTEPGADPFGAVSTDRVLLAHVVKQVRASHPSFDPADPANWNELHDVARRVSAARRRLDGSPAVEIDVHLGGVRRTLRVLRSELEELIVADVLRMASRVGGTLSQFRTPVDAVTVHGAAASIPLVAETLSARIRRPVVLADTPEAVVIKGAVLWGVGPVESEAPTVPTVVAPASHSALGKPHSRWARSRVWAFSGTTAVVLVLGGFFAAHTVGGPQDPGSGASVPSAQMVSVGPSGR